MHLSTNKEMALDYTSSHLTNWIRLSMVLGDFFFMQLLGCSSSLDCTMHLTNEEIMALDNTCSLISLVEFTCPWCSETSSPCSSSVAAPSYILHQASRYKWGNGSRLYMFSPIEFACGCVSEWQERRWWRRPRRDTAPSRLPCPVMLETLIWECSKP